MTTISRSLAACALMALYLASTGIASADPAGNCQGPGFCVVDARGQPIGVPIKSLSTNDPNTGNVLWRKINGQVYSLQYLTETGIFHQFNTGFYDDLILLYSEPNCPATSTPYIEAGVFLGFGAISATAPRPAGYSVTANEIWGGTGPLTTMGLPKSFFYGGSCTNGTWGSGGAFGIFAVRSASRLEQNVIGPPGQNAKFSIPFSVR